MSILTQTDHPPSPVFAETASTRQNKAGKARNAAEPLASKDTHHQDVGSKKTDRDIKFFHHLEHFVPSRFLAQERDRRFPPERDITHSSVRVRPDV